MTTKSKEAKKLVDQYFKDVKDSETVLGRLQKQAEELQTVLGNRENTKDEIVTTERRIASLESEREALKGDYAEAMFEGDAGEQQKIVRRRNAIDRVVQEQEKELERLRSILDQNPVDGSEVAKLKAEIDSFREPYALGMVNELRDLLTRDYEISSRHHDLKNMVPEDEADENTYHDLRMELDGSYASTHRAIQKEAAAHKKQQERAAKYVSPFSTPSKVDPRVSTKYVGD